MDLERQTGGAAILHAVDRALPAARERAELVVLFRVERVERDAHGTCPGRFEVFCHLRRDQRAIRAEDGEQAEAVGKFHELEDVRPHERLAARENHNLEACALDFGQELFRVRRRELVLGLAARIAVAMSAVHVAGVRHIPRDNVHKPISSSVR